MLDKNQIVGFALLLLILLGWSYYAAPSAEEIQRQKAVQDSLLRVEQNKVDSIKNVQFQNSVKPQTALSDSAKVQQASQKLGSFAQNAAGEESEFVLENELISLTFSNKGGRITSANLKDHKKIVEDEEKNQSKTALKLLEDEKNRFEYLIASGGRIISTQELIFNGSNQGNKLVFRAETSEGGIIEQSYTLLENSYKIDYDLNLIGLHNTIDQTAEKPIQFRWINYLDKLELNDNFEQTYSTVHWKESEESPTYCTCRGDDEDDLNGKKIEWVSHVNQFFNSTLIAKSENFNGGTFKVESLDIKNDDLKKVSTTLEIPFNTTANSSLAMQMYVGPNEFNRLNSFENDLEFIIPFGNSIFGSINRHFIRPFFNFLSGFIGSKGIVIVVLIFIIKMLLYPLMYKMLHSQAKMGALKPQLAGLKEKFKDEPQKVQMETMKIYKEYGVSPLGGCMPMVIQMPIWYALFRFFPASITFRQEPFLWATDLSSYDAFFNLGFEIPHFGSHISLFTVLWAVTTLIYTYYNTKHMDMSANPAMKYVQYFMPVMFLGFFNSYASGLTCYMFFSNIFNILQTVITKTFIFDDDKIKAELDKAKAKPKKPKKKGGFQARMEEALKKQQEAARKQQETKSNKRTRRKK